MFERGKGANVLTLCSKPSIAPAIEKNQLHLWVGSLLHISCFPCLACCGEKNAFCQILFEQEILKPKWIAIHWIWHWALHIYFWIWFFSECNHKSDIYWCMQSWNSSNSEGVIFALHYWSVSDFDGNMQISKVYMETYNFNSGRGELARSFAIWSEGVRRVVFRQHHRRNFFMDALWPVNLKPKLIAIY